MEMSVDKIHTDGVDRSFSACEHRQRRILRCFAANTYLCFFEVINNNNK